MIIEGLTTRRVESTPNQDPTLGASSRQEQEKRGQKDGSSPRSTTSFADVVSISSEAQREVSKLQQRDREVRSHEQAHISAGGPHVQGGASYTYTQGPDNKQYATGGSVRIDTSPVAGDADATKEKARMVRSAALAPGSPSAQDQSVAAQAASLEMQAQTDKSQEKQNPDPTKQKPGENQDKEKNAVQGVFTPGTYEKGTAEISATDAVSKPESTAPAKDSATPLAPADSTGGSMGASTGTLPPRNMGGLLGVMGMQARSDRVAAAYQAQQDKFIPPSELAPWGTGIDIKV